MTDTAVRLGGPASLTTSSATLYTVPASTKTVVRSIHLTNTSASQVTGIKLSIGADAAGTRFLGDVVMVANSTYDWSGFLVLAAAEILKGQAGTTNVITYTISGVEIS